MYNFGYGKQVHEFGDIPLEGSIVINHFVSFPLLYYRKKYEAMRRIDSNFMYILSSMASRYSLNLKIFRLLWCLCAFLEFFTNRTVLTIFGFYYTMCFTMNTVHIRFYSTGMHKFLYLNNNEIFKWYHIN